MRPLGPATIIRILVAISIAATMTYLPSAVAANGRVTELVRKAAGPYEIALGTIPATPGVGSLHLTMTVTEVASGAMVLDAEISLLGTGPGSTEPEVGPLAVRNNPNDPQFYDVDTSVDRLGTWTYQISVSAEAGEGTADFLVEVKDHSPLAGIITIVVLMTFLLVIALAIRAYLRERGRAQGHRRR